MKRILLLSFIFCALMSLTGCGDKEKVFVAGDNELIHLTSTPRGGVETYEIYTTNIMIYVDGTVKIYASDFVRWFGEGEIPEFTFYVSKEEVEAIKQLIVDNNLYNLREDVGNKDGISGTVKQITVYGTEGTNTTGGISVSNRQFTRSYDGVEAIVREELFLYQTEIKDIQYKGFVEFSNRRVELVDRTGACVLNDEVINDVYAHTEELGNQNAYYVIMEFNQQGGESLKEITYWASKEDIVVLSLHLNGDFETKISINAPLLDYKLYIPQESEDEAIALAKKITESMR